MAEAGIAGQVGLNIGTAPQRVIVGLGPIVMALTVDEARNVLAQLTSAISQVAAQLVIATPDQLPPMHLNGHG